MHEDFGAKYKLTSERNGYFAVKCDVKGLGEDCLPYIYFAHQRVTLVIITDN